MAARDSSDASHLLPADHIGKLSLVIDPMFIGIISGRNLSKRVTGYHRVREQPTGEAASTRNFVSTGISPCSATGSLSRDISLSGRVPL